MIFLAVALYFLVACFALWLVLFPSGQEFIPNLISRLQSKLTEKSVQIKDQAHAHAEHYSDASVSVVNKVVRFVTRHHIALLIILVTVSLPPLLSIVMTNRNILDGFGDSHHEVNTQIAELLKGEQLVAPAPLPPAVFLTQEVMLERPMLSSASRNWEMLNQDYAQRLLAVFKIMKEQHGYQMVIIEGYRSPERQDMLAKQGKSVTNAKAFQSYHQYGLAADCAFFRNGKLIISEKDPWAMQGYQLYGELAEAAGLTWGGRWKMMDFGHTELRLKGTIKK